MERGQESGLVCDGHDAIVKPRTTHGGQPIARYHRRVPRFRLLVTDLDGTLLNRKGQVSESNLSAIRRLQDSGVEVIPATGRALRECGHVLDFINHAGHAITAGGALVHDARDGSVVIRRGLSSELARAISEILGEHGHLAQLLQDHTQTGFDYVMVGDHPLDPATEWWFNHLPVTYRRVMTIAEHTDDGHTMRAGTVAHGALLEPIVERLRQKLGDQIFVQHWSALTAEAATGSPTHLLEAFGADVNKWTAIEALCADYGIDPAEVATVGDGLNDLEMIRSAGLGIAMENADPRIAAVAGARAGHHDRDGFATAAELVLAANRSAANH
jgi:hydroxymethylpyrimidine pyrophosphatase-like HAD family hydrolase